MRRSTVIAAVTAAVAVIGLAATPAYAHSTNGTIDEFVALELNYAA